MDLPPPVPSAAAASPRAYARAPCRFEWWLRVILAGAGGMLIALLGVARWLEPSPQGYGTHQQLGLPQCSFQEQFGRRCPACGMTTSWAYLTRGNLVGSLSVNSGGTLLGLVALASGPWLLGSGLRGRWVGGTPHEYMVIAICVSVTLVILTDWGLRLIWG
jgi:hypothetical protein